MRMNGSNMDGIMSMDGGLMGPRKMYQPAVRNLDEESPRPPSRHRPPSSNLHLHSEDSNKGSGTAEGSATGKAVSSNKSSPARGGRGGGTAGTADDLVVDEQEPDEGSEIVAGSGRAVVKGSNQTQSLFMSTTVGGTYGNSTERRDPEQGSSNTLGQDLYDLTLEPPREHAIPIQITTRTRDGGHAITSTTTLEVAKLHMKKLALEQKKRLKRLEKKNKKKKKGAKASDNTSTNSSSSSSSSSSSNDKIKKKKKHDKKTSEGDEAKNNNEVNHSPRAQEVDAEEEDSDNRKFAICVNSDDEEQYGRGGEGGASEGKVAGKRGAMSNPLSLNLATMKRQPSQASLESQRNQRLALQEYEQALISSRTTPRRLHSSSSSRRPIRGNSGKTAAKKRNSTVAHNTHAGGRMGEDYNVHDGADGQGPVPGSSRKGHHTAEDFGFTGDHPDERAEQLSEQRSACMRARTADVGQLNHATSSTDVGAENNSTEGEAGAHYRPPQTAYADVPDPISNPRIAYSDNDGSGNDAGGGDGGGRRSASSREARDHERRKERRRRRRRHRDSRRNYDEVDDADTELREWERQMANNSGGGSLPTSAGSSNHPTPRGGGAGGEGWFKELFGGRDEGGRASSDDASSFYSSNSEEEDGQRQRQQRRHRKHKPGKKKKKKKKKRHEVEELFSGGTGPNTSRSSRRRGRDEWSLSSQSL